MPNETTPDGSGISTNGNVPTTSWWVTNELVPTHVRWHPINSEQLDSLKHGIQESTILYSIASGAVSIIAQQLFSRFCITNTTMSDHEKWALFLLGGIALAAGIYGVVKSLNRRSDIRKIENRGVLGTATPPVPRTSSNPPSATP